MEKTSILKRRFCFWLVQLAGLIMIMTCTLFFQFSLLSVIGGMILSYVNMEFLFRFFRPGGGGFLIFLLLKNILLIGGLYILKDYVDGFSFLLGLTSMLFYLAGLSWEVLKYKSL